MCMFVSVHVYAQLQSDRCWSIIVINFNVIKRMTSNTMHLHPQPTLLYNCAKWIRVVSALFWRSYTCFCPYCGNPNYPVFVQNFFITCLHPFL